MINGIHHTAISTPDADRLLAFYRDVLGFRVVWDTAWTDDARLDRILELPDSAGRVVMLRAANALLELFEFVRPRPTPQSADRPVCDHGVTHIALDVTDIDAEYRRLRDAGMRFHAPPVLMDGFAVRTTYGRDPDGNVIELQEILDPDSDMRL